jgi:hypothetical protein
MSTRSQKLSHAPIFFILAISYAFLLSGCEDQNALDPRKSEEIVEIDARNTDVQLSVSGELARSSQNESFSVIGKMAESEMKSEKYQLSATLVIPSQKLNKRK